MQGSAAAPGLNGARLAAQGNMIVVILQYRYVQSRPRQSCLCRRADDSTFGLQAHRAPCRLGVLGFLPPALAETAADPNLGLRDVILGLRAIKRHAPELGGDASRVTLGGQSSGAGLIRGKSEVGSIARGWGAKHRSTVGHARGCRTVPRCDHAVRPDGKCSDCTKR